MTEHALSLPDRDRRSISGSPRFARCNLLTGNREQIKGRNFFRCPEKNSERSGFEPENPVAQVNCLAGSCFQPLSHLSKIPGGLQSMEFWPPSPSKIILVARGHKIQNFQLNTK